jgi:hypothetical protein
MGENAGAGKNRGDEIRIDTFSMYSLSGKIKILRIIADSIRQITFYKPLINKNSPFILSAIINKKNQSS